MTIFLPKTGRIREYVQGRFKSFPLERPITLFCYINNFQILKTEFATIQCATTELRSLTDQLAEYFCEEESQFNIQEFFQCLLSFCKEVKKCQSVSGDFYFQFCNLGKKSTFFILEIVFTV